MKIFILDYFSFINYFLYKLFKIIAGINVYCRVNRIDHKQRSITDKVELLGRCLSYFELKHTCAGIYSK